MLGWGLLVNVAIYVAFIPSVNRLEKIGIFDNIDQLVVFAGYFCTWYLIIVAIAVVYRIRRDIVPNWNVNRWGN
ncbi:MAG: hypothetical protein OXL37_02545 [Chloroflexota bacterium]|nr:hypothetical protein [Chloroflexota bacterium]MDE2960386.1 hypothetical protein [Chloroflexota bacterium]